MNTYYFTQVPHESSIDISEIDVILISNSSSILALPFFTEHPDFNGNVYATGWLSSQHVFSKCWYKDFVVFVIEPTVNIGKFFMEELVEFVQNVPKPRASLSKEADGENIYKMLESSLNFPIKLGKNSFNRNLREIYSKKSISDALLKIQVVGFNENIVSRPLILI